MIALAIELSTAHASAALFKDEQLIGERAWHERYVRKAQLFGELSGLLEESRTDVSAIHTFIVGRGPGSYSGLRCAIAAATGLALPGKRTVFAVSSGEALALETARREQAGAVAVLGDARRRMLWTGVFRAHGAEMEVMKPWTVIQAAELGAVLREPCVAVTPDWLHLSKIVAAETLPHVRWVQEARSPHARDVGRLGLLKLGAGHPSEALTPIYTHPPVG